MLKLVASETPLTHLLLGRDTVEFVREKIDLIKTEFEAWLQVSTSTDFE